MEPEEIERAGRELDEARREHKAQRDPGKLTQFKRRMLNRVQRRREGDVNPHTTPGFTGRTGRPEHVTSWRTTSDQDLVLRAIRLGVVRTGTGRQAWGPGGQHKTRKALFVAVTRAEKAGVQSTKETRAAAQAVETHWRGAHRAS